jgi:hypothetical protein
MTIGSNTIPFGLATITIGSGVDAVKLDGVNYFQADGGELNIEPEFEDVSFQDFGSSAYDKRISGYTGELKVVVGQNDLKLMQKLFSYHADIMTTGGTPTLAGLTDAKIGQSMREKAVPVTIHPREMGADTSLDIHIYKMAGTGAFNRTYESAQGKYEVTLEMFMRDNADPTKNGNFYYIGSTDPNAVA